MTKSAPSVSAARASANECTEAPIRKPGGQIERSVATGSEVPVRCTPSAPTARATSDRSLTSRRAPCRDRKSTRLNSSHVAISYAVLCLKKKKKEGCSHTPKKKKKNK